MAQGKPKKRSSRLLAGCSYSNLTSPMTDHHLLLAPKAAPQPTCQKCRRHGDSVHRLVRHIFFCHRRHLLTSSFVGERSKSNSACRSCVRSTVEVQGRPRSRIRKEKLLAVSMGISHPRQPIMRAYLSLASPAMLMPPCETSQSRREPYGSR